MTAVINFTVKDKSVAELGAEAVLLLVPESSAESPQAAVELPERLATAFGSAVAHTLASDPRCGQVGWSQLIYSAADTEAKPTAKSNSRARAEPKADGPTRLLLVGVGKPGSLTADKVRSAFGRAGKAADDAGVKSLAVTAPTLAGDSDEELTAHTQAAVEGLILATYHFGQYKPRKEGGHLSAVHIAAEKAQLSAVREGVRHGVAAAEAQNLARTLAELPGNALVPDMLAKRAEELAGEVGLTCEVFDEKKLARLNMHAILNVGQGSCHPPRLVVLTYAGGKKGAAPVALVGKGITFDSGGISLKESTPSNSGGSIDLMRTDKTGACAVIAAMTAIAKLGLKINVVGLAACAENMPSHTAYRPGDIIGTYAGKTVEIMSTDAEGRLVLADALAYTVDKLKPQWIVNVATLTGACSVALGEHNAGLFANDDGLADRLIDAARFTGEPLWRLPLQEPYREQTKSKLADLLNSGGRPGGACTAAAFLWEFVGDTPWAHLDIAGVMYTSKPRPYLPPGAIAYSTRTLIELVRRAAE